ncbi:glycosyltransferase [Cyclobacterium sp.]|uniref:glycosyltransferase n=1 Tax=Cyclobacterium sp. TaxID=1966343 RepID=UPI001996BFE4|nr:glycosyltransferase [Cyclobacterium sp.]MBD3629048.1 glycosyltransferase [Cyclobacterium sp.]
MQELIQTYIHRFQVKPPFFPECPSADLCMVVVIPSFKEPDIRKTLESLYQCDAPDGIVEIIVVINAAAGSSQSVLEANQKTVDQIESWKDQHKQGFLQIKVIREEKLAANKAGAGWARKIGMDEALRRWGMLGKDGPILCLDADCEVSPDYFQAAQRGFSDPAIKLAHFQFDHLYRLETDQQLQLGIIQYELHLRCYIQGLKWAGYPFACHTVGSCMAVKASAYARSGGMNRRKAGEDFYFMHKLLPVNGFTYLSGTVYPSCRISDRVPFGTGRAQLEYLAATNPEKLTYHPDIYRCMKSFFIQVPLFFSQKAEELDLPHPIHEFLKEVNFESQVEEIRRQSSNKAAFFKRFWQWMDGFMVLKLTHYLRDRYFPNLPVKIAGKELLFLLSGHSKNGELTDLLEAFKALDSFHFSRG